MVGELIGQATIGNAGVVGPDANAMQNSGGAAGAGNAAGAVATIPIKTPIGQRDVYVVVRNFSAKADEPILSIATISFIQ